MTNCPKCGRPVGGRARACGYCGESLVSDYFQRGDAAPAAEKAGIPVGGLVSMTLGIFAGLALLAALGCHLWVLFGVGGQETPPLNAVWWTRTALMTLLPMIYLGRQLALRGRGGFLPGDCFWLFLFGVGLGFTVLVYINQGVRGFYGMLAIPFLLTAGCSLAVASEIAGVLTCHPEKS